MVADAQAAPKRQRILIVEDEPFIALALEAMLLELGFGVAGSAAQVSAALQLIGREQIDGAILDVNLGSQRIDPVADLLAARA
ncbi:MAG: response regulator, partial [Methylocella sp.]